MAEWVYKMDSAWKGHEGFAEALVKNYGAKKVIELGVDRGYSCFVFAVAGVDKIYGIDLWEPDPKYGYGDYKFQLEEIAKQHGIQDRILLIRGRFNEVVKTWEHGLVDVLHIDGTHYYNDVKEDFELWLPHVKEDGVVIMHDVCVPHFTVKEYFNEITLPKAWFSHSYGLGVVCRNQAKLDEFKKQFPNLNMGNI